MFVHVKTKRLAFMSVFAAISVLLMFMGEIISVNTLFFITAAAFLVGIMQSEYGNRAAMLFFCVCIALSLIVLPNKMHCLTYGMIGFNIWFWQFIVPVVYRERVTHPKKVLEKLIRLVVFNLMYIPLLIFFPKLIFAGEFTKMILGSAILLGQVGYFAVCYAFRRFEIEVWGRLTSS